MVTNCNQLKLKTLNRRYCLLVVVDIEESLRESIVIIDCAYYKKNKEEKLGDFLLNIDLNEIKQYFNKVSNDCTLFLNIYNILTKYYKDICCNSTK